jgi:putative transcriptional regulator
MNSLRGHFLVASPHLGDENFFRSVVLMIQHDDDGAFGVVLNRPTNTKVGDLSELEATSASVLSMPIYLGGPVDGPLIAVHTDMALAEYEVTAGVYFSASADAIKGLVARGREPFRLFQGYAGWAPNQLDSEIKVGGWLTEPARYEDVFSSFADLWDRVSHRIGEEILSSTIRRGQIPDDPSMN